MVAYAPDLIRIRYHFTPGTNELWETSDIAIDKELADWSSFTLTVTNEGANTILETDELRVECVPSPNFHVNFYDKATNLLQPVSG